MNDGSEVAEVRVLDQYGNEVQVRGWTLTNDGLIIVKITVQYDPRAERNA